MNNSQIVETAKNLIRQFAKFGVVGVVNTMLFYLIFLILSSFITPLMSYYTAYVTSMVVAVYMHLRYTFQKEATFRKVALFIGTYLTTMVLGGFVLDAIIGLGVVVWLAGLITVGLIVVTNFLCFKAAAKWA